MITAQAECDSVSGGTDLLSKEDKTKPTETPLQSRNEISTQ